MSHVVRPPDLRDQIADLTRRLNALERTLQTAGKTEATDANGVLRALMGPLDDAGGAYVGQFGIYIADGSGNVIVDNQGVRNTSTQLVSNAFAPQGTGGTLPFTTTFTTILGTKATFNLARSQDIVALGQAGYNISGGTANYGYVRLALCDASNNVLVASSPSYTASTGVANAANFLHYEGLATGNGYYVAFQYRMDSGAATTMFMGSSVLNVGGQIDVLQLGS